MTPVGEVRRQGVIETQCRVPQTGQTPMSGRANEPVAADSLRRYRFLETPEFANEIKSGRVETVRLAVAVGAEKIYRSKFNVLATPRMMEWE